MKIKKLEKPKTDSKRPKTMKAWREFEQLVSLIERQLALKEAVIKSPDRIKDRVTGRLREVDASIRYQIGSVPILITIECRDRSRVSDDTWIEQIASKRGKIGANQTIAVSRTGFSESAKLSAKNYGIELRTITEITGSVVDTWVDKIAISKINTSDQVVRFEIEYGNDDDELDEVILTRFQADPLNAHLMYRTSDDTGISSKHILDGLHRWEAEDPDRLGPDIKDVLRSNSEKFEWKLQLKFSDDSYYTLSKRGKATVREVEIQILSHITRETLNSKKHYKYSNLERDISEIATVEFFVGNDKENSWTIFLQ